MSATASWLRQDELDDTERQMLADYRATDQRPALRDAPSAVEMPETSDPEEPVFELHSDGRVTTVSRELEAEERAAAAAEERVRQLERQSATASAALQAKINTLVRTAATSVPAAREAPEPSLDDDPVGHFAARSRRLERQVESLSGTLAQQQRQQHQQQQVAELRNLAMAQEMQFMQREPSYADAMKFLVQGRQAELEALGVTDPAEQQRIIGGDVTAIAVKAARDGAHFAERLFNVARKRGFAGQGGAQHPSQRAGSRASASPARLTPEAILAMPDDKFSDMTNKLRRQKALALLMGG